MDRQIKIVIVILIVNFLLMPLVSNHYAYYIPRTHTFSIQENGVPNGTTWGVKLFGYEYGVRKEISTYYSHSSEIELHLPYGYYHYTPITPSGYESPSGGSDFHLSEPSLAPISTLSFLKLYNLYFHETGLASNSSWGVTVSTAHGQISNSSKGNEVGFSLPVGSYQYKAVQKTGSVKKVVEYPSVVDTNGFSPLVLNASSDRVSVSFTNETYQVTVNITARFQVNNGNLNGIKVQMDGQTHYSQYNFGSSNYSRISFGLPNGVYQYSTPNVTGYAVLGGQGNILVDNAPANVTITYKYIALNIG